LRSLTVIACLLVLAISLVVAGVFYYSRQRKSLDSNAVVVSAEQPTRQEVDASDGFDYPVGNNGFVTQAKDKDGWYNAQDFGENNHLGEDWNANTGGNSDCGQPVYAASHGTIVFAGEAGAGWGKVVIIRHRLQDGALFETLYGHLQSLNRTEGNVRRREKIGTIGDADGAYPCHLHFELRNADCPSWGATGPGYSEERTGWTDPSDFIDARRRLPVNPA
jgi:murein DD-endopeptidase MepM/ murein hydrolase activator NlpD